MNKIRIAIVGIGNCASSLIQGIAYYKGKQSKEVVGLMHWEIGGFKPYDIEVVAAFDIDKRKVGRDVAEAIFSAPNCTTIFCSNLPKSGVTVRMGRIMDGFADHMKDYEHSRTFVLTDQQEPAERELIDVLKESGAEILLNYLPVGSEEATRFYAECALQAGVAFINNIPVFIASDPVWARRFKEKNVPIIGDDIKAHHLNIIGLEPPDLPVHQADNLFALLAFVIRNALDQRAGAVTNPDNGNLYFVH